MGECEKEPLRPKEFYREKIIEIIKKIDRTDVLQYLYFFISGKVKDVCSDDNGINYKPYSPQNDRAMVAENNALNSKSY